MDPEAGDELDFVLLEDDERPAATNDAHPTPVAVPASVAPAVPDRARNSGDSTLPFDARMAQFEKQLLLEYLGECDNLAEAARRCGLPRATLQSKIKRHGIRLKRSAVVDT